jgi:hypothetical protein
MDIERKITPKKETRSGSEPASGRRFPKNVSPDPSLVRTDHQAVTRRLSDALEEVKRNPIRPGIEGAELLTCLALAGDINNLIRDQARDILKLTPDAFPGWHLEVQEIFRLCRDRKDV